MKTVLTIAGSDPSGGAGLQRDLETFRDLKARGLSVVAALTAQNSTVVRAIEPVSAGFLKRQVNALLEEFRIDAVKIGMTGSAENLRAIRILIKKYGLKKVVLDPVMRSTSGRPLLDKDGIAELKALLPLVALVTPNLPEATLLTGIKEVTDIKGMEEAVRRLHEMGAPNVLVKGGHLEGAPQDLLYDGRSFNYFAGKRITGATGRFHGTGCILSAAIAAGLANGKGIERAILEGRAYLMEVLRNRPNA